MAESYWKIPAVDNLRTPLTILKEQAEALKDVTQGLLYGDVSTSTLERGLLRHEFEIIAPALNNYTYRLFSVTHSMFLYPVSVSMGNNTTTLSDEGSFIDKIKEILGSDETSRILAGLLAQVRSA